MRQQNRMIIISVFVIIFGSSVFAQTLKVTQSLDNKKIDRNSGDSIASIIIDSHVKDLTIENDMLDEMIELSHHNRKQYIIHVDIKKDRLNEIDNSTRSLLLNSPKSSEYILETDELLPKQVYYYTVILPDHFNLGLSAEYLFTKTAKNGIRIIFGKRFGGYLSYKWGHYYKAGANIESITEDYDISKAESLGYIRTAIMGGGCVGLISSQKGQIPFELHMLIGAGFGEFGRQWVNNTEVNKNIYFYSDYAKGIDAEIALRTVLYNWISLSVGLEMITGNGNITFDYQIGLGVNIPVNLLHLKNR